MQRLSWLVVLLPGQMMMKVLIIIYFIYTTPFRPNTKSLHHSQPCRAGTTHPAAPGSDCSGAESCCWARGLQQARRPGAPHPSSGPSPSSAGEAELRAEAL